MIQGTIRRLIHLCSGTDYPSTHLVTAHNGAGYGYIESPDGDVFFDDLGLKNRRFDQLRKDAVVEYVLDNAPYLRASSVTVLDDRKNPDRQNVKTPLLKTRDRDDEMLGDAREEPIDAIDESSLESFPASDSPAHHVATASRSR